MANIKGFLILYFLSRKFRNGFREQTQAASKKNKAA